MTEERKAGELPKVPEIARNYTFETFQIRFGGEVRYLTGSKVGFTPQEFVDLFTSSKRPDTYHESHVCIEMSVSDLASLFGSSTVEAITRDEWYAGIAAEEKSKRLG